MTWRRYLLWLSIAGFLSAAQAEEDPFSFTDEDEAQSEAPAEDASGNVASIKFGYVTSDNFGFSRFADLADEGAFLSGDVRYRRFAETSALTADLTDLGFQSRELAVTYQHRDLWEFDFSYAETPFNRNNTGATPFAGDSALVLPAAWTGGVNTGDFPAALISREIGNDVLRKALRASLEKRFDTGLRLAAAGSFENKAGVVLKGMTLYSNAANPQAVLLPSPVDQDTTEFSFEAGYSIRDVVVSGALTYTTFDNKHQFVTWENPYSSGLGAGVDFPAGIGGYAGAPDYDMLALSISSAWRVSSRVRVTLDAMTSESEQQEPLAGYTANSLLAVTSPLPATELPDALETNMLNVAVVARPFDRVTLKLRYRFNDRANGHQRLAWQPVPGDGANQLPAPFAVFNRPYEHEKDLYTLEGSYRLPNRTKITLRWDYEETFRNYAAVSTTEEDTFTIKVQPPATDRFVHRLELSGGHLSGSTYEWSRSFFQSLSPALINQIPDDQRWINHPLLRQYHLANQEKTNFNWSTSWFASDRWTIQGVLSGYDVNFDESELGLTGVSRFGVNVSLQYTGDGDLTGWAWLDFQGDSRDQSGRDFGGGINKPANRTAPPLPEGSNPARNYDIGQDTNTRSVGVGVEWRVTDRLSVTSAYSWTGADETFDVTTYGARDLAGLDLPDVEHRIHSLDTELSYRLANGMVFMAEHRYFRYTNDDWAFEDIAIGDIDKVLTTGLVNPDEVVNLFTLGMSYRF